MVLITVSFIMYVGAFLFTWWANESDQYALQIVAGICGIIGLGGIYYFMETREP